jgi:hypothetical protein
MKEKPRMKDVKSANRAMGSLHHKKGTTLFGMSQTGRDGVCQNLQVLLLGTHIPITHSPVIDITK